MSSSRSQDGLLGLAAKASLPQPSLLLRKLNRCPISIRKWGIYLFGRTAEPQISPLRFPGFPVDSSGVDQLHAVSFTGNRIRAPGGCREVGNPGYASVEMTKGRGVLLSRIAARWKSPRTLFGNYFLWKRRPTPLSSRPKRSAVERSLCGCSLLGNVFGGPCAFTARQIQMRQ